MQTQTDLTARLATCPAECWTFQGRDTSPCILELGHVPEGAHLTGWPGNKFEQTEADEVTAWQLNQT
jgi:hypothetical protein